MPTFASGHWRHQFEITISSTVASLQPCAVSGIFAPGFSTADQVTDVSGRGVGMDVVKKNITALGGTVDIDSAKATA